MTNVNGQSDPGPLSTATRFREMARAGVSLERTMQGKRPRIWSWLLDWVQHADKGQTTADAARRGIAEPTSAQQQEWEDINRYAYAEMTTISVYMTKFGVKETVMMMDRRDVLVSRRTAVEEHILAQETFFILREYTGGPEEAEQALRRMPIWCRHLMMTPSTILDVCLVQVEEGNVNHFSSEEDSEWSFRVRAVVNDILSDFDETKYGHLPEIIYNTNLRHLSADVTKPPATAAAKVQARAASRTVFGSAGTFSLLAMLKKLPGHLREMMVAPLERVAQLQGAVQASTLEAEAVPEDSAWCRYAEYAVVHVLNLTSEFSRRTLRDGRTTDQAHTTLSELHEVTRKISLEKPQRCSTVEGALNCMRLIIPDD